jgi:hypothetical protein
MILNPIHLYEWLSLHAVALSVNAYRTVAEGVEKVSRTGFVEPPQLIPVAVRPDRYRIVNRNTRRYTMR